MTTDQINYWRNVEQRRNNLAMEAEARRANLAREAETHRANLAQERETKRANTINARVTQYGQGVTNQHYIRADAQNALKLEQDKRISLEQLKETMRSNKTREQETQRTNIANEKIKQSQVSSTWANLALDQARLAEQQRTNRVHERIGLITLAEQGRANMAREMETNRSNLALEGWRQQQIGLDQQRVNETRRSNVVNETLKRREQMVTMRGQNMNLASNLTNSFTRLLSPSLRSTKGVILR